MHIIELTHLDEKLRYLDLLREADPSEELIMRYLPRGRMFLLEHGKDRYNIGETQSEVLGAIVVVDLGDGKCEVKNLTIVPHARQQGFGRMLIEHVAALYTSECGEMLVAGSEACGAFYEKCGFSYLHRVPRFFSQNYPKPIYFKGKRCVDLHYYRRMLQPSPLLSICYLQTHRSRYA